jgi:hypothetical protein
MLTGESRFHISTPLGTEPGSLMTGSKQVDHWTSGPVYECSEIAGTPHSNEKYWELCYRPGLLFISKSHRYERSYNQFQGLHNIWIGCACANWHNLENRTAIGPVPDIMAILYAYCTVQPYTIYGAALYHIYSGTTVLVVHRKSSSFALLYQSTVLDV